VDRRALLQHRPHRHRRHPRRRLRPPAAIPRQPRRALPPQSPRLAELTPLTAQVAPLKRGARAGFSRAGGCFTGGCFATPRGLAFAIPRSNPFGHGVN
jgi:hypothetical protein